MIRPPRVDRQRARAEAVRVAAARAEFAASPLGQRVIATFAAIRKAYGPYAGIITRQEPHT